MTDFNTGEYKPQKNTDGFEPFKLQNGNCLVNWARIEEYSGEKPEFAGNKYFRYELVVCDGQPNAGRRLWKSYNLDDKTEDKKGKTKIQKLADLMFTLGMEFKDEASFQACIEKFAELTLVVNARFSSKFVDDEGTPIQLHTVKGIAKEKGASEAVKKEKEVPF